MTAAVERRLLQGAVILACLVPLLAGASGVLLGAEFLHRGPLPGRDLDSHLRYLSGLLLGIGLGFLACVPGIERRGTIFRTLALIVAVGGLARLLGVAQQGAPGPGHIFGLVMELVVVPALALWQVRLARRFG